MPRIVEALRAGHNTVTASLKQYCRNLLPMVAELEWDLISATEKEALADPESRRTTGRAAKLTAAPRKQVLRLHEEGEHTPEHMFGVSGQTVDPVVADIGRVADLQS